MTVNDNREIVRAAVSALEARDYERFSSFLDDDVVFSVTWSAFRPFVGRERVVRLMIGTFNQFRVGSFKMPIDSLIAEGDTVVELSSGSGIVESSGVDYANTYCRVWQIRGGWIISVREFMDTEQARALTR